MSLAERWNGTSWQIQSTPAPTGASGSGLAGVSCPSSTACTAGGSYHNRSGGELSLAERWNGTSWRVQSTPDPAGASFGGFLNGVSCPTGGVCLATGYFVNSDGVVESLAERWSAGEWTIDSVPAPSGATDAQLNGASCPSSTACTAVGSYVNSAGGQTLAEHGNGTSWQVQSTP
jgi:hypothetical protein